ncbi:hypothetical protein P152DRAFT_95587 [Eremomyces bilateralis CBS 781.70]|uniref:Vegetative cell wall protein gp1 n=1 Tax=Eremomyces bilateralis CBS 781.70 TaxID=1392243 RepID=A0A6G1FWX7_9PEZI|nr:uncharacterized protein P152DRAFT_95587 [Eremomyces bilateralis CBS 781.70]KAF1810347.1 hypothetical protein P152DRAFT_95587 [Eremomyces bilateralis CBS 781.70]
MNYGPYAVPPPYPGTSYEFRTPPVSPPPGGAQYFSSPRYNVYASTPSPRGKSSAHARRTSHDPASGYHFAHNYGSPRYASYAANSRPREPDYVSGSSDRFRRFHPRRATASWRPATAAGGTYPGYWPTAGMGDSPPSTTKARYYHGYFGTPDYVNHVIIDDDNVYRDSPPPPYEHYQYHGRAADHPPFGSTQVPIYESTPQHAYPPTGHDRSARARRASHGAGTGTQARPYTSHHASTPTPKSKGTPKKESPKATEEDARRAGIPAGYSLKHWDPTEEPILLLGSVFSPDSIGRWIYDWTVFRFGPATPMADVAGDLWLLLIHLSGKVKRADHIMPRIRREENRDTVEEFLESGDRLLVRFKKLLKICEEYMWRAAKRENGEKKPSSMGRNAGVEFVDTMFGRDRELDKTEKLMSSVRLWSLRFDANVDEILRNPTA